MEQYFWYIIGVNALFFALINKLVRGYIKDSDNKLKLLKEEYENKNTALSVHFNCELLKLKFSIDNKPKYSVGDKLLNDYYIVLWSGISDRFEEGLSNLEANRFYNKYEVFVTEKKIKVFIAEKDLEELIKKATV